MEIPASRQMDNDNFIMNGCIYFSNFKIDYSFDKPQQFSNEEWQTVGLPLINEVSEL